MAMNALSLLIGIVSLVCWIMVVIRMFRRSILWGLVGIFTCGLGALIWGFMNKDAEGLGTVMLVWSLCIIINLVMAGVVMSMGPSLLQGATPVTP